MHLKFTVEYLKTRGVQNLSNNGIEFLGSLLIRISYQMNFACLNHSLHAPLTVQGGSVYRPRFGFGDSPIPAGNCGPISSDIHMLDRHVRILYKFMFYI
jgi:hypothetical protein